MADEILLPKTFVEEHPNSKDIVRGTILAADTTHHTTVVTWLTEAGDKLSMNFALGCWTWVRVDGILTVKRLAKDPAWLTKNAPRADFYLFSKHALGVKHAD